MKQIVVAQQAEALAYARGIIARMHTDEVEMFGIKVNWLSKTGNRRFVVDLIKQFSQWRVENLMDAVDHARAGWSVADEAMRGLILEYTNRGEPLPTYLAAYNMEIVSGRTVKRPARQKADYFLRDMAILCAIILVMERFGLKAHSRDGQGNCACSLVAKALAEANMQLGYKAVAEIWRKYGKIAAPQECAKLSSRNIQHPK